MSESAGRGGGRQIFSLPNLSFAYCFSLLFVLTCVEWAAESWLPFTILLFAPPVVFISGFFILTPLMLWRRNWRHITIHAICVAVVFTLFMRLRWHQAPVLEKGHITVITHNIGQGDRNAFTGYFPSEEPDVVLLQDAGRARSALAKQLPKHRIRVNDQFTILTPHTILRADIVDTVKWRERPVAARYELMINGREIAFYNVHMPTPRPSLRGILSPRVWLEIVGIRSASTEGFPSYRAWIDARIALLTALVSEIEKEKLPFIVGGDFNMPDHGRMYRIATKGMTDAFAAAGNGWGLTFPGGKDSALAAMLGPWLRIDYLFAGKGWKPVECRTANDPRSQHRAVFGRFAPAP
jgi:vancomycin resistance protein VanJ